MEVFFGVQTTADAALVGNNDKLVALLMCKLCDIKNSKDKDETLTSIYMAVVYVNYTVAVEENSGVHGNLAIS